MKVYRIYLLISVALVCGAFAWSQAVPPGAGQGGAGPSVAVCDITQLFNNYQRAKDLSGQFEQRRTTLRLENDNRGKELDKAKAELDGYKLGSEAYEKKFNEIQKLTLDRKSWLEYQETVVMRDHHRLTREMYDEVTKMIGRLAKDRNIRLVLFRERDQIESDNTPQLLNQIERRKVLYADDGIDITDQVLGRLNEAYQKK